MNLLFLSFTMSFFISFIVVFLGFLFNYRTKKDREKSSPFECGFDPKSSARIPFSTRFFLLAVIFLVFDIEIALIVPLPVLFRYYMKFEILLGGGVFLVILMLGLLHEWREGSLDWKE